MHNIGIKDSEYSDKALLLLRKLRSYFKYASLVAYNFQTVAQRSEY